MGGRRRRDSGSLACRTSRTRCHGGPAGDGRNRRFACSPTGCGSRLGRRTRRWPSNATANLDGARAVISAGAHVLVGAAIGRALHGVAETRYRYPPAGHQRREGARAYGGRHGLPGQPRVFQRYAQEHPRSGLSPSRRTSRIGNGYKSASSACNCIAKAQGLNIWTCDVTGPRKSRRLYGYLLHDVRLLFAEPPPNNPYLSLRVTGGSRAVQNATRRTNPQRRESERRYRLTSSFEAL